MGYSYTVELVLDNGKTECTDLWDMDRAKRYALERLKNNPNIKKIFLLVYYHYNPYSYNSQELCDKYIYDFDKKEWNGIEDRNK